MKKHLLTSVLAGILLPAFCYSQNGWGVDAFGSILTRLGTSGETSGAGNPSTRGTSDVSGGSGINFDEAAGAEVRGSFASNSALRADMSAFIETGTYATCLLNETSVGLANAVDRFTYKGDSAATFTLQADLSGHFVNTTSDPSPYAGNFANVFVIFDDVDDYGSVIYGQGEIWTNWNEANLEQSDDATVLSDSVTFDLAPGETISVWVNAWSRMFGEDGVADALSTVTVGFSSGPAGDLIRDGDAIVSIPEPRFAGFLFAAIAVLAVAPRRKC